jgi:N6-adenosine-specific RNA methylase IME4
MAAADSFLFLWVTTPQLPDAFPIMAAWGFRYSGTAFVWAKLNPRGGYGTRKNVELCLRGRRGQPARRDRGVRELFVAPRREHSRKPDEQYERIERLCTGPYLELFARQRRPGWTSIGDEADRFTLQFPAVHDLPREKADLNARGRPLITVD